MSARLLAAGAIGAVQLAAIAAANAADLYYPPHFGSAYDDPRYAEIYRDRPPIPPEPVYGYGYGYGYGEREDRYGRYDGRPRHAERADYCLPRHLIRQRLKDDGWRDIHPIERRERVVLIEARRPNGHLYDLTVDRCTGDIVEARPLREEAYAPQRRYADGPRRWSRGPWRDWY